MSPDLQSPDSPNASVTPRMRDSSVSSIDKDDDDHMIIRKVQVQIVNPALAVTCIKRSPFSCPVIENFTCLIRPSFLCPRGDLLIQV